MRRLIVPVCCAAVVAAALGAGVAGAGGPAESGRDVAKTTMPTAPTVPAAPVPAAPVPTVPVPTAPPPTVPVPVPVPTIAVTVPGVPTTEASGLSPESLAIALPIFGLDMPRLQCVDAALPSLGSDDNVAIAALQGCGVGVMPLLRGIVAVTQASNSFLDATATTVALPPVPGIDALPTEDTFLLGFMLVIDNTKAACLATGLASATSEDDATAFAIFQQCGVPIAFTIDMLTFGLIGAFDVDPSAASIPVATVPVATVPVATVPVATVPVATVPVATVPVAPNDPLVDEFQEILLEEQGISLDDAQAACLLSHIGAGGDIDTEDTAALFGLLDSCGITLSDLVPEEPKP